MKYFSIEIQTMEDGSTSAAIYERGDDLNDAIIANHTALASMRTAVDAGTLKACTGLVMNEKGGVEVPREFYEKDAVAPEG